MANIKSAKKSARQAVKRQKVNVARKSSVKTAIKKVLSTLSEADIATAQELLRQAEAKIARAKNKGLLHKRTAQRKISRLATKVAKATKPKASK